MQFLLCNVIHVHKIPRVYLTAVNLYHYSLQPLTTPLPSFSSGFCFITPKLILTHWLILTLTGSSLFSSNTMYKSIYPILCTLPPPLDFSRKHFSLHDISVHSIVCAIGNDAQLCSMHFTYLLMLAVSKYQVK